MSYTQLKWLLRSVNLFRPIFPEALFWQEFSFVGSKGFEPKLYAWASSLSLSGSNYGIRTRISRIIQSLPLLTAFLKSRNSLNWGKNWSCCCPRRRPHPLASSFQNEPTFWLSYLGFLFFVFYLRARFFAKMFKLWYPIDNKSFQKKWLSSVLSWTVQGRVLFIPRGPVIQ